MSVGIVIKHVDRVLILGLQVSLEFEAWVKTLNYLNKIFDFKLI